jgi:hypothetical protein
MGEKFAANPVTGTGSMSVPIATTPGRSDFYPKLSLSYDSGNGNSVFGFGWSLSLPAVTRKTDKGLPRYWDTEASDVFLLSEAEDLVPVLKSDGSRDRQDITENGKTYDVQRYRPRIEGLFARIERWQNQTDATDTFWKSVTKENVTSVYGRHSHSRIADPTDASRIFKWLLCESYDDRGNAIVYEYAPEDSSGIDLLQTHEGNRTDQSRSANGYLKRIQYGNRTPRQPGEDLTLRSDWLFDLVFDYDEGHYQALPVGTDGVQTVQATEAKTKNWSVRPDPFSSFRSGFEIRTYRLCQRLLMFHRFDSTGKIDPSPDLWHLVRSTDFTYNGTAIATTLTAVTQSGYVRANITEPYRKQSLPPLEFEYTQPVVDETVRVVDATSLENLLVGLGGAAISVDGFRQ